MKRACVILLALAIVPAALWAQTQTTSSLTGRVTDDNGQPIAGADATIESAAIGFERSTTTSSDGTFFFNLLPSGQEYTVTVTATGMQPQVLRLRLGVGAKAPLDIQLAPGEAISETVNVTAIASEMETTTTGETFNYDQQVELLPLPQRDPETVALLSPNVSFGPTPGTITIAGAPSFDTTVMLDGAEISDPYFGSAPDLFIEEALEEVQVITTGVSARYGRFQGGVINAITKSGSNDFSGSIRLEMTNQEWNSQTPFEETQSDHVNKGYQATLGGPVVRDRFWFFGGIRTAPTETLSETTRFTGESYAQERDEDRYHFKLNAALNPSHLVEGTWFKYDSEISNYDGLPAGDDRALGIRTDPRETYTLSYQGVLSPRSFLEIQATQKDVGIHAGGDPGTGRDPFIDLNFGLVVYNNHWWDFDDPSGRDNQTAGATYTYMLDTASAGSHSLEGGLQWVESTTSGENKQTPTNLNLLVFNPDFFAGQVNGEPRFNLRQFNAVRWEALTLGGDQIVENRAAFVQDAWTFGDFRFDLGVRYDEYDGEGPLPQFGMDFQDWGPRLGITYNVNPSLQVQATYGKYVSRLNDSVVNSATGVGAAPLIETFYFGPTLLNATAEEVQAALRNNAFWPLITSYTHPDAGAVLLANDIEAPYANDLNLSVRTLLPRNLGTAVLTYTDREYNNLLDQFVGGVCDYGLDFAGSGACPGSSLTEVPGENLVDTVVWANTDRARRDYEAMTLIWDVHPSSVWQFGGNYTYAETQANYEGEGRNTPASGSAIGDFERAVRGNPADVLYPYGNADDDIRHRASVWGVYNFDFDRFGALSLGSIFNYRSGLPYSLTASVPHRAQPDYIGTTSYTHFFGGRGSRRFDSLWSLDFSTRYEIPIFRDFGPFLKLVVTNLTDEDGLISHAVTGRTTLDAAGNPTGWIPSGNCGLNDEPSRTCTGFGRIRNELDYQDPREFLIAVGFGF